MCAAGHLITKQKKMHREDNSNYILFLEPNPFKKSETPLEDDTVLYMEHLMNLPCTKKGTSFYSHLDDNGTFREGDRFKGIHRTGCGEKSENYEYLFGNGMITNSLAPYYLRWYRNQIPLIHLNKLIELFLFYKEELKDVRRKGYEI